MSTLAVVLPHLYLSQLHVSPRRSTQTTTLRCVMRSCGTFVTRRPHLPSPLRVWTLFWWSLCSLPSTQHGNKGHTHTFILAHHASDIRVFIWPVSITAVSLIAAISSLPHCPFSQITNICKIFLYFK